MRALWVGLWCVSALAFAGPRDIHAPPTGRWAKDTSGKISAATLQSLDLIAQRVDASGKGQLGVLIVDSTNGQDWRAFATEVFNHWGIGHAGANDGILLFVALGDRKAEIVLGDGLTAIPTSATDAVMRDQVVRNFKAGNPQAALLEGAQALHDLLAPAAPAVEAPPEEAVSRQLELTEARVRALVVDGALGDRSPRSWVIDLTGEVPEDVVRSLEQLPNELYASDKPHLFVVVSRTLLLDVVSVKEAALRALSIKHPEVSVLAINLQRREAALGLSPRLRQDARADSFAAGVAALPGWAQDRSSTPSWATVTQTSALLRPVLLDGFPTRGPTEVVGEVYDAHEPVFMGAGGLFALGGFFWFRRWNRYRPRTCEHCQRPRQMLGVGKEDEHLSAGQRTEQNVGSIDYDVWWCGVCRTVLIRDNTAWLSGYGRCSNGCGNRTLKSTSTTLVHATEYSGGLVQVNEACAHCSYRNQYKRTTARITRSSSSSSSSSSSRSSFGGGSSSGRGSSGSW